MSDANIIRKIREDSKVVNTGHTDQTTNEWFRHIREYNIFNIGFRFKYKIAFDVWS